MAQGDIGAAIQPTSGQMAGGKCGTDGFTGGGKLFSGTCMSWFGPFGSTRIRVASRNCELAFGVAFALRLGGVGQEMRARHKEQSRKRERYRTQEKEVC